MSPLRHRQDTCKDTFDGANERFQIMIRGITDGLFQGLKRAPGVDMEMFILQNSFIIYQ